MSSFTMYKKLRLKNNILHVNIRKQWTALLLSKKVNHEYMYNKI